MAAVNVAGKGLLVVVLGLALCGCEGWSNHRQQPCAPEPWHNGGPGLPPRTKTPAPPPGPGPPPAPEAKNTTPKPAEGPPTPAPVTPKTDVKADTKPEATVKVTTPPAAEAARPAETAKPTETTKPIEASKPTPLPPLTNVASIQPPAAPAAKPSANEDNVPAGDPSAHLRRLHRLAEESANRLDAVTARLTRREQVNGKDGPEEVLSCKFRKEPFSVYFKWIGQYKSGREVV